MIPRNILLVKRLAALNTFRGAAQQARTLLSASYRCEEAWKARLESKSLRSLQSGLLLFGGMSLMWEMLTWVMLYRYTFL